MDYEKKYKEALERARNLHKDAIDMGENLLAKQCEIIFPELKESENWIPKEIIKYLKEKGDFRSCWIAWLEKQGEQKPTDKVESMEHSYITTNSEFFQWIYDRLKYVYNENPNVHYMLSLKERIEDMKKSADKVKPKFKVGDTMRTLQEASNGITDGMPVIVSIDNEYYRCNNEIIAIKDQDNYEYPPINKKHNAWSEEDELHVKDAIHAVHVTYSPDCGGDELIDWLKSLKDRMKGE